MDGMDGVRHPPRTLEQREVEEWERARRELRRDVLVHGLVAAVLFGLCLAPAVWYVFKGFML